jgi:hypothetical protein
MPTIKKRSITSTDPNGTKYLRDDFVWAIPPGGNGGYDGNPETIQQNANYRFTTDAEKTTWNGKAAGNHNHDGVYQAAGNYATSSHNHDSAYAALNHNHDASYAALNHNHDGTYSAANHNHNGVYAAAAHNHDASYAAVNHTHNGLPAYSRVTGSNATTTGQALADIAGLSLALLANSVYEFEACLSVQSSSTAGNGYGVNFSAAGATVEGQIQGTLTATSDKTLRISALNTAASPYCTIAGTGAVNLKGIITVGANAGNITIKHLKVTSGTATVFINSYLKVTKIQ